MSELRVLTWADFERFEPCCTQDGNPIPEWGLGSGTMLDILRDERIHAADRLWAFTRKRIITGTKIDVRMQRLFACKCVRSTPLYGGGVVWDLLTDDLRYAVEIAERYAIGRAKRHELLKAIEAASDYPKIIFQPLVDARLYATWAAGCAAMVHLHSDDARIWAARAAQSADAKFAQVKFAIEIIEQEVK